MRVAECLRRRGIEAVSVYRPLRVKLQKSGRLFQVRVETVPAQVQISSFASV